MHMYALICKR